MLEMRLIIYKHLIIFHGLVLLMLDSYRTLFSGDKMADE